MLAVLATATTVGAFEAGMLACFGASWPVAIFKTLRSKKVTGKSLGFLVLIFLGYLSGVGAKLARAATEEKPVEWVAWLYVLNALLVAVEIALYLHYRKRPDGAALGPAKVPVE